VEKPRLTSFYYVDESDLDIMVLCRQDRSIVAAFSAGALPGASQKPR
jgi:hypothetical protein